MENSPFLLSTRNKSGIHHNIKIHKNNSFLNSSSLRNNILNYSSKNKSNTFNALIKDLEIYKRQSSNKKFRLKLNNQKIKDIDIIKEKDNSKLLNKISNYLDQKKKKIILVSRIKDPNQENLKNLLHESKSEGNILAKTFSTKFVGNEEYNTLSQMFENGHHKKIASELKKNNENKDAPHLRKTQSQLFSKDNINSSTERKEKKLLNSIKLIKKNNIGVSSLIKNYDNQYDSFKSLQTNKNLFKQLILKQEKEQIKQFLKGELENEQNRFTLKLMPPVHTIELSKLKKLNQEKNNVDNHKLIVNSIYDIYKIPRNELFYDYNAVYLKTISKFISTPTCRVGAKMLSYFDDKTNSYKILLFGGINVIRLDDLWECSISSQNRTSEKKYIWKKVQINGDKPLPRNGHSMVYYKDNLIIFGGVIEEKGGNKVHEDLLCYDINEKKFAVEMCMNKFGVTWRSHHISEMIGQYMFIYGGEDEKGNILAEPWALDLDRMRWEPAKFNSETLPKRKFHCSCQVFPPQKKYHEKFTLFKVYIGTGLFNSTKILVEGIYMFGGIDDNFKCSNDVLIVKRGKPLQLFKAITKGKPPVERCECTMDFFEKLDVVIIYGGKNERSSSGPFFNDMYFLDVETLNWINIELNYNKHFYPRGEHCSCIVDNELIIFGGENEKFFLKSDLLICNLDIGESSKIIKNRYFNKKNRKKDKNGFLDNNNFPLNTNSEDDNESINYGRFSIPFFEKAKLMQQNSGNKITKDTKILMNQKIQTSHNFFLDFPKQKNELQEKFKEIDAIKFKTSEYKKVQDIIKNSLLEFNSNI